MVPWTKMGIFKIPDKRYSPQHSSKENLEKVNRGVGSHSLLQGIFLTQGQHLGRLHCR